MLTRVMYPSRLQRLLISSVQQAARARTGSYTGTGGKTAPAPTGEQTGGANRAYTGSMENPYGRYVSGKNENGQYTSSFKPEGKTEGKPDGKTEQAETRPNRRSSRNNTDAQG